MRIFVSKQAISSVSTNRHIAINKHHDEINDFYKCAIMREMTEESNDANATDAMASNLCYAYLSTRCLPKKTRERSIMKTLINANKQ